MEELSGIDSNLPEVEIVYQILKSSHNQSRKLRELLQQAFTIKGTPFDDPQKIAAVHTEIILDHRFISLGQGNWGLKEWTQGKIVRRTASNAGAQTHLFRRRSLLTEIDNEEEVTDKYEKFSFTEDEEWEE